MVSRGVILDSRGKVIHAVGAGELVELTKDDRVVD